MKEQKDKSPEFIQEKYIQLLEKSNVDMHQRNNPFSFKNILVYSGIFSVIILLATTIYLNQYQPDVFKDHLFTTNYNTEHVLLETKQGVFYQISKNTNKKWLADNGVFINVTEQQISFTSTKPIPNKKEETYTLWIPKGKQYKLINTDGTKIHLNSNSKLTFSNIRNTSSINATLKGEAFFDVAHNPNQNYTIRASKMNIEVFGTSFNISNYTDNATNVALVDGSVKINNSKNDSFYIKPGQQASLQKDNTILISDADFSKTLAWTSNQLYFTDEALASITEKVGVWYDVQFKYKDVSLEKIHFTGNLTKENGLTHFLEILKYTEGIDYRISEKEVSLSKAKIKTIK